MLESGGSIVPQTYRSRFQTYGVDLRRLPIVCPKISIYVQRCLRRSPISFRASSAICFPEVLCYHFEEYLKMVSEIFRDSQRFSKSIKDFQRVSEILSEFQRFSEMFRDCQDLPRNDVQDCLVCVCGRALRVFGWAS